MCAIGVPNHCFRFYPDLEGRQDLEGFCEVLRQDNATVPGHCAPTTPHRACKRLRDRARSPGPASGAPEENDPAAAVDGPGQRLRATWSLIRDGATGQGHQQQLNASCTLP